MHWRRKRRNAGEFTGGFEGEPAVTIQKAWPPSAPLSRGADPGAKHLNRQKGSWSPPLARLSHNNRPACVRLRQAGDTAPQ
jgi:hypothetical protein